MKFKMMAVAAMLAVSGASAFANGSLGDLNMADGVATETGVKKGISFSTWTFELASASDVSGLGFYTSKLGGVGFEIYKDNMFTGFESADIKDGYSFSGLTAGSYEVRFGAFATAVGGAYSASFEAVAAPVPEPETYAMMLAGLGALGFLARRRRQG